MANHPINTFTFEGHEVRVVVKDGEPWWIAADVCAALEIDKHRDALARLDIDERGSVKVDTLGGPQEVGAVSESGLYTLILRSRKPAAHPFRRWVTHEVLPAIRKTGVYAAPGVVQPLFEQSSYPTEWSQDAPHKLEQARKCAKGTYEITKNDVLPLLKQILGVLDERSTAPVASHDFAQIRDRLAHLMAQFAAFDQVLRPAVRAEHIMLRPLKNLADMVESLRQSLEQRGNMPAEMMIVRMAADTIQGITPNKGVEPSASVAGKILARAPRAPRVGA